MSENCHTLYVKFPDEELGNESISFVDKKYNEDNFHDELIEAITTLNSDAEIYARRLIANAQPDDLEPIKKWNEDGYICFEFMARDMEGFIEPLMNILASLGAIDIRAYSHWEGEDEYWYRILDGKLYKMVSNIFEGQLDFYPKGFENQFESNDIPTKYEEGMTWWHDGMSNVSQGIY